MEKGKVKDFFAAMGEEGFQEALESKYVPEIVTAIGEMVTTENASMLLGAIVGAAAPRLNAVRLNYLEKRFEARVGQALSLMKDKIELLESNYGALNEEIQEKFRGIYVEWFMDNLYSEKQPEKVSSHVNGYINMMSNDVNDNIMIMFMQTLNQLTQLDIDVLRLYQVDNDETAWNLSARYGIQMEQLSIIKEKLVRFGLLYSKQDDLRDENIDAVVKYLMALEAEQKKKNPKNIKMKNLKKPKSTESYYITPLGNDFLRKISD